MSINGIGTYGYSVTAGYRYGQAKKTETVTRDQNRSETLRKSEMAGGSFVLHYFDHEEGERTVGASCGRDYSISAYIPKDFDPENPVYKVKVWDKDGNVTERMVDLKKVDPENSDYIDMFAYSSYLECSGKCPGAQSAFMGASRDPHGMGDMRHDDLFDKVDWMGRLKAMMQMQYDAGNLTGYLDYKKYWDFLQDTPGTQEERITGKYNNIPENPVSAEKAAEEEKLTVSYNGTVLRDRSKMDKKYTDKETGISFYVADGKHPYITGEDVEKLRELCASTGEPFLKKMCEITGMIRHLDENTTAYIGDNGTVIKSKDGRELSLDTSSLSYDVLSFMFQNIGASDDYFNKRYWADQIQSAAGRYLTGDF